MDDRVNTTNFESEKNQRWKHYVFGIVHSIELSLSWLIVYAIVAIVVVFIHVNILLNGVNIFWAFVSILFALLQIFFLFWLSRFRQWKLRTKSSLFLRYATIFCPLAIFLLVMVQLYIFPSAVTNNLITKSIWAGIGIWIIASIIVLGIALLFGPLFNKDFASLRKFPNIKKMQLFSGFFLFIAGAIPLVFWPLKCESSTTTEFFRCLFAFDRSTILGILGIGLLFTEFCLFLWIFIGTNRTAYKHLAGRITLSQHFETELEAKKLIRGQRIAWWNNRSDVLWPKSIRIPKHPEDINKQPNLKSFNYVATFSAVSLIFALSIPIIIEAKSPLETIGLGLLLLITIAGGIDLWLQITDIVTNRGIMYTFGLWSGTFFVYMFSTIVALIVISDFLLLTEINISTDFTIVRSGLSVIYTTVLGALTLVVAVSQVNGSGLVETSGFFRQGISTSIILILMGALLTGLFVDSTLTIMNEPVYYGVGFLIIIVSLILVHKVPRSVDSWFMKHPLRARLVASSTTALIPLIYSDLVVNWTKHNSEYLDLFIKNVGSTSDLLRLRVNIVGSEEEVAFVSTNNQVGFSNNSYDFILTDLNTALDIIAYHRNRNTKISKAGNSYKITDVVAVVPWRKIEPNVNIPKSDNPINLDAGYIPYSPPKDTSEDDINNRRQGDFATIAYYGFNSSKDLSQVHLPEPYVSWLCRKLNQTKQKYFKGEQKLVVYVLLTQIKNKGTKGHPPVAYNWRRILSEILTNGRRQAIDSMKIIDHDYLDKFQQLLLDALPAKLDFHASDLQLALNSTDFVREFPESERYNYAATFKRARNHNLISHIDSLQLRKKRARELEREDIFRLDYHPRPQRYYKKQADHDIKNPFTILPALKLAKIVNFKLSKKIKQPVVDEEIKKKYLIPIMMVEIPNQPGKISQLLSSHHIKDIDFELLTSINLGTTALVYLINKQSIPKLQNSQIGKPLPHALDHPSMDTLSFEVKVSFMESEEGFNYQKLEALMVPVKHKSGGLKEILIKLNESILENSERNHIGINIEQITVFPIDEDYAIALIVVREDDWNSIFNRLNDGQYIKPTPFDWSKLSPLKAKKVEIDFSFNPRTWSRHQQMAIFKFKTKNKIPLDLPVTFYVKENLSTWTPGWGNIDSWFAEYRFNQIRLMIPTQFAVCIRINSLLKKFFPSKKNTLEEFKKKKIWRAKIDNS